MEAKVVRLWHVAEKLYACVMHITTCAAPLASRYIILRAFVHDEFVIREITGACSRLCRCAEDQQATPRAALRMNR